MQKNSFSADYERDPNGLFFRNWTYVLPNFDDQLTTTAPSFNSSISLGGNWVPSLYSRKLQWNPLASFNYTNGASIPTLTMLAFIRTSASLPDLGAIKSAYLCGLSFCAQRRNVSLSHNQLSSTILQNVYGTPTSYGNSSSYGSSWIGSAAWLHFTGSSKDGEINMTYPSDLADLIYVNATWESWDDALDDLQETYNGNVTVPMNWAPGQPVWESTSNFLTALINAPDVPMAMNNAATALTNYLRDSSNTTVVGQGGQHELYIRVSWPWITLPALLVVAGLSFLILAMFETKRRGACVWKTSELALLIHGQAGREQQTPAIDRESEMERVAQGIRVRLGNSGNGGWTFSQEKPPEKAM